MTDSTPISADAPELRLLCQLAGIKPSALAAALADPVHFSNHISADDVAKYLNGASRLFSFVTRANEILAAELNRATAEINRRTQQKKGRRSNA